MAPRRCSIEGCEKPVRARGWCGTHYMRWYAHGDPLVTPQPRVTPDVRGEKHPNWKGGRWVMPDGHIRILVQGRGYIYEHRLVMEQALGRRLSSDEIVHHINHDPADNRLENLQIVTRAEHASLHGGRPKVERVTKPCAVCGTPITRRAAMFRRSAQPCCSRKCVLVVANGRRLP